MNSNLFINWETKGRLVVFTMKQLVTGPRRRLTAMPFMLLCVAAMYMMMSTRGISENARYFAKLAAAHYHNQYSEARGFFIAGDCNQDHQSKCVMVRTSEPFSDQPLEPNPDAISFVSIGDWGCGNENWSAAPPPRLLQLLTRTHPRSRTHTHTHTHSLSQTHKHTLTHQPAASQDATDKRNAAGGGRHLRLRRPGAAGPVRPDTERESEQAR